MAHGSRRPTIPDGGDQVTQLLTLLMVPVALTSARSWHWSAPQPTAGREIGSLNPNAGSVNQLLPVVTLPVGVAVLTWGTIAFEFTLALGLVLSVRARGVLLPLGISFHVLIGLLMGLGSFALAMIAALLLYLHPAERPLALRIRRLSGNVTRTVLTRVAAHARSA